MSEFTLPEKKTLVTNFTYEVPHVLVSMDGRNRNLRQGGPEQIEQQVEVVYTFEKPEKEAPFLIKAPNRLNFGSGPMNVLNDEVEINGVKIPPSSPSASEYMAKVGKRVLINTLIGVNREMSKDAGKTVYREAKIYITLP